MRTTHLLAMATLAGIIVLTGLGARADSGRGGNEPPPIPAVPHDSQIRILHAQRFDLDEPYTHWWRAERPRVSSGWLLVLSVDPDLVFPRQSREPVLFVGEQTAERVNVGNDAGRLVAIVPADVFLTESLIFFGNPALPEEVDAAHVAREITRARERGVLPPTEEEVAEALRDSLRLADDHELRLRAIDLVEKHSPLEVDLIRGARAPRLR